MSSHECKWFLSDDSVCRCLSTFCKTRETPSRKHFFQTIAFFFWLGTGL